MYWAFSQKLTNTASTDQRSLNLESLIQDWVLSYFQKYSVHFIWMNEYKKHHIFLQMFFDCWSRTNIFLCILHQYIARDFFQIIQAYIPWTIPLDYILNFLRYLVCPLHSKEITRRTTGVKRNHFITRIFIIHLNLLIFNILI